MRALLAASAAEEETPRERRSRRNPCPTGIPNTQRLRHHHHIHHPMPMRAATDNRWSIPLQPRRPRPRIPECAADRLIQPLMRRERSAALLSDRRTAPSGCSACARRYSRAVFSTESQENERDIYNKINRATSVWDAVISLPARASMRACVHCSRMHSANVPYDEEKRRASQGQGVARCKVCLWLACACTYILCK